MQICDMRLNENYGAMLEHSIINDLYNKDKDSKCILRG